MDVKHQAPPATGCAEPREEVAHSDDKARGQARRRQTARAPIVCPLITGLFGPAGTAVPWRSQAQTWAGGIRRAASPARLRVSKAHVYYSPDYTTALAHHSHARRQQRVVRSLQPFMDGDTDGPIPTDSLGSRTCCGCEEPHSPCRPPVQVEAVQCTPQGSQHLRQDCQRLPRLTSAPGLGRIRANSALALPATPRNANQHQRRMLLRPRLALRSGAARRRAFRSQRQPTISQSARGARRGAAAYR